MRGLRVELAARGIGQKQTACRTAILWPTSSAAAVNHGILMLTLSNIARGRGGGRVARLQTKLEREKDIVVYMISLFCRAHHTPASGELCPDCAELAAYACERSDRCPYQETKTFCVNCQTHCYRPEMRDRIREVMRYAGPRMAFHRPIAAIRHLVAQKQEARRLAREASASQVDA